MIGASASGAKEIVFHAPDQEDFKKAKAIPLKKIYNPDYDMENLFGGYKKLGDLVSPQSIKPKDNEEISIILRKLEKMGIKETMTEEDWQKLAAEEITENDINLSTTDQLIYIKKYPKSIAGLSLSQ